MDFEEGGEGCGRGVVLDGFSLVQCSYKFATNSAFASVKVKCIAYFFLHICIP